ncbi:hypothetical protein [Bartonella sp. CDC_skunk]|uniref:hypothetical protein n=1 Tax=Bartonella sp. CDC_skunk TaxID=1933905 RepID=UPI001FDA2F5F|nr:hypothetical protein [Bartonella sp. CDC_skunk]
MYTFFWKTTEQWYKPLCFKTPWLGDPRVNIQKDSGNKAKAYQVKQVLQAIERMKHEQ